MEGTVVPHVRTVDAPEREAVERPFEVVRLGHGEQSHAREASEGSEVRGRPGPAAEAGRQGVERRHEMPLRRRRPGIGPCCELEARVLTRRTALTGLRGLEECIPVVAGGRRPRPPRLVWEE